MQQDSLCLDVVLYSCSLVCCRITFFLWKHNFLCCSDWKEVVFLSMVQCCLSQFLIKSLFEMEVGEFETSLSHLSSKIISVPIPENLNLSVKIPYFPLPFSYLVYGLKWKERHNHKISIKKKKKKSPLSCNLKD